MAELVIAVGKLIAALYFPTLLIGGFALSISLPWLAFSITRHVKGIHRELEQLNQTIAGKVTFTRSGPLGLS